MRGFGIEPLIFGAPSVQTADKMGNGCSSWCRTAMHTIDLGFSEPWYACALNVHECTSWQTHTSCMSCYLSGSNFSFHALKCMVKILQAVNLKLNVWLNLKSLPCAGRGIIHSEMPRVTDSMLHGFQVCSASSASRLLVTMSNLLSEASSLVS